MIWFFLFSLASDPGRSEVSGGFETKARCEAVRKIYMGELFLTPKGQASAEVSPCRFVGAFR